MRVAKIENGLVVNVAVVGDERPDFMADWVDCPEAGVGWSFDGEAFTPPAAPEAPVPASITFAQLLIGLVAEQWISEAEGEGWLGGALPGGVLAVIDTLPPEMRFAAKARALRPSEVLRHDQLVAAMGGAAGKTEAEIDDFFRKYAGV